MGGKFNHILSGVKVFEQYKVDIAILHCVSEYPNEYDRLGLDNIKTLNEKFPHHTIGLSIISMEYFLDQLAI